MKKMFVLVSNTGGLEEKIRILPTRVEPLT